MNEKWLKMSKSKEERLQVKLEKEKMAHEMDVQVLNNAIKCVDSKLDFIARYRKSC